MITNARQLLKTRDLIWAWTVRTLRGRYQQSALGWFWAIVQPVAAVAIFTLVFTRIVPVDTGGVPYIVFSYTAVVPWTLLATSITDMAMSLVQNMNLVGKIYFQREALPIATLLARLADFGIAFLLLALLVIYYGIQVSPVGLLFLPLIFLIQLTLILGLGIGAAALNVFYRDVDPLLKLFIQIWFYASPILYPISLVPEKWRWLYFLNPMAGIITAYRDVLIYHTVPGDYLLPAALVSLTILIAGYWFFKKVEFQFADII
ncbi:MAG: ABC transporter permease [Anaerolineales bacterium]|nr:ABC transporter permease [Anaerolineales bacterium]